MLAFFQKAKLEQKIQVYQNLKPLELLESLRGRDNRQTLELSKSNLTHCGCNI